MDVRLGTGFLGKQKSVIKEATTTVREEQSPEFSEGIREKGTRLWV